MGPDEFVSREELTLIFKFLLSKIQQQGEAIAYLMPLLSQAQGITKAEVDQLIDRIRKSSTTARAKQLDAELQQHQAIHKIAKQYLDPPEE